MAQCTFLPQQCQNYDTSEFIFLRVVSSVGEVSLCNGVEPCPGLIDSFRGNKDSLIPCRNASFTLLVGPKLLLR